MKMFKKVMMLTLIATIVLATTCGNVMAAEKNVTTKMAKNKKVVKLVDEFETLSVYQLLYVLNKGEAVNYNFSRDTDRRIALMYNYKYMCGQKRDKVSKRLFGKKTSKVSALMGDWGETNPEVKIRRVYKIKKNTYRVECSVFIGREQDGTREFLGRTYLQISKSKKSTYGYVAKKLDVVTTFDYSPEYDGR